MREGQTWMFGVVIVFAGIFFLFIIGGMYASQTTSEGQRALTENYINNLIGEQMLLLPCASESRGVYYNGSIVSGDFRCFSSLVPNEPVYLKFEYETGTTYEWKLLWDEGSSEMVISKPTDRETFYSQSYDVVVKDMNQDSIVAATMSVGAEAPG